jgi:hypothetical protein
MRRTVEDGGFRLAAAELQPGKSRPLSRSADGSTASVLSAPVEN